MTTLYLRYLAGLDQRYHLFIPQPHPTPNNPFTDYSFISFRLWRNDAAKSAYRIISPFYQSLEDVFSHPFPVELVDNHEAFEKVLLGKVRPLPLALVPFRTLSRTLTPF